MTSIIKLLIFIPKPRDIPEFNNLTAQTKENKLWIKYYHQEEAYRMGRDWFLEHKEYSHICILCDDLLVTPNQFEALKTDISKFGFDVVSGWCRNTIRQTSFYQGPPETEETAASNISFAPPPDPPRLGDYNRYHFITLRDIQTITDNAVTEQDNIIKVKFAGFPPTIISRRVIEQIPFRTPDGCCTDSGFCLDIAQKGIDNYCDLRVRTIHINASEPANLLVGKRPQETVLECA